eukprot:2635000-Prymnesium_polylepis.1
MQRQTQSLQHDRTTTVDTESQYHATHRRKTGLVTSVPRFQPTTKAWPPRASGAPRWFYAARDAAASCARRKWHGDRPSPCHFQLAARPGCSPTAKNRGGAAEP